MLWNREYQFYFLFPIPPVFFFPAFGDCSKCVSRNWYHRHIPHSFRFLLFSLYFRCSEEIFLWIFFFLSINTKFGLLDWVGLSDCISKYGRILSVSFFLDKFCIYQTLISCVISSRPLFPLSHTYSCAPFVPVCCIPLRD